MLQNFAAQAVFAMENARLLTETREALEQQTATAEVLQVINSSPGDLAPVFDAMLEKAMRLCEASFGMLRTFEGECFHLAAARNVPAALHDLWRGPTKPAPGGAQERLARGERFVHHSDPADDEGYRRGEPTARALGDLAGVRTYLTVPLRQDERLLGSFAIYRKEVRPFTYKQIALLENFAAQAVIAMENARLLGETREALEQQTATAEVLQVINSSPGDLIPVFNSILEKAHSLCGCAQGTMELYDGERFRAVAMRNIPEQLAEPLRRGVAGPESLVGSPLLAGERFFQIADVAQLDHPLARVAKGRHTVLSVPCEREMSCLV